jgi:hypothetical protein
MTRKTLQTTFVAAIAIFFVCGLFGFGIYKNQPTADNFSPIIPAGASWAADTPPSIPDKPVVFGDATDDGITNSMDINALLFRWGEADLDYKLTSDKNVIGAEDIFVVLKFFGCKENQKGCNDL